MPQLVPRDQLQPANALLSLTRNGLTVIGPTVGALLVVTVGSGWALAVDALTWLLAALLLVAGAASRRGSRPADQHRRRAPRGLDLLPDARPGCGSSCSASASSTRSTSAPLTLGPVVAEDTIGRQGWGYVLSAEAAGLLGR